MSDFEQVTEQAQASHEATVAKLLQIPRFKAALAPGKATQMTLQCPHRHTITRVVLWTDNQGRPCLDSLSFDPTGTVTNGWQSLVPDTWQAHVLGVGQPRVRLQCAVCNYDGTKTQAQLLALYAVSLQKNKRTMRLTE